MNSAQSRWRLAYRRLRGYLARARAILAGPPYPARDPAKRWWR